MKRFEWQNDGMVVVGAELEYAPMDTHEFVVYEEARLIEVDRDIKAANLKTLVGMVLDHDDAVNRAVEGGGDGGDVYEAEELHRALLALARGLKQ